MYAYDPAAVEEAVDIGLLGLAVWLPSSRFSCRHCLIRKVAHSMLPPGFCTFAWPNSHTKTCTNTTCASNTHMKTTFMCKQLEIDS